ncbi:MAG: hypothetical protein QXU40_01395 [Candidatus Pacearchaeota archaeon]
MSKVNIIKIECPKCGHSIYIKKFYNKKRVNEKYISEMLNKYEKYEKEIEQILNLTSSADKVNPSLENLQKILEFINETPENLSKFIKSKNYYIEKRLYLTPGKGGLNYFLAICRNTKIGDKYESLSQKDNGGIKPAGKEI